MLQTINTKILLSAAVILASAAVIVGATFAFFADTETSTANTFAAGELDLKVDSESHYNGLVCAPFTVNDYRWLVPTEVVDPEEIESLEAQFHFNQPCDGTWLETDLGAETTFFNFTDIKPGDIGENTISLHVYNNDAWGRMVISNVSDFDNNCTEPEEESDDICTVVAPEGVTPGSGELAESISFYAWIDDGATPGFQGTEDVGEGDNVKQVNEETVIAEGTLDEAGETHNIWPALAAYRVLLGETCELTDLDGNGQTDEDGDVIEEYVACQGIATDGRMVGSTTYYFGLAWNVPTTVGNEAQSDSLSADLGFEVVQHRNNPDQEGFIVPIPTL